MATDLYYPKATTITAKTNHDQSEIVDQFVVDLLHWESQHNQQHRQTHNKGYLMLMKTTYGYQSH